MVVATLSALSRNSQSFSSAHHNSEFIRIFIPVPNHISSVSIKITGVMSVIRLLAFFTFSVIILSDCSGMLASFNTLRRL